MKRSLKTWLPFAVVAVIALWWLGALNWFATPTTETPPPVTEPAPSPDATIGDERSSVAPVSTGPGTWPIYHGETGLTGRVALTMPDTLTRRWSYQAPGPVYSAPVASADRIFFNTSDGWVVAVDGQGAELWSKQLMRTPRSGGDPVPERFEAPIACFDSAVLLGSSYGTLYALEAATGETRWSFDVDGPVLGTVNMIKAPSDSETDRLVVIDQDDGALQCLDVASGEALWRTEGIDRCDGSPSVADDIIVFGSCAAALHVFSVSDGALLRNIELGDDSQVAGGVALEAELAFSGSHSGKVFHANTRTGAVIWTNEDSDAEVFTTPAVDDTWVVFGSLDGNVYALDRTTGATVWTFETSGEPSSAIIADDTVVFSSAGTLYLLRLDSGEELWSYNVSDAISGPSMIWGMVVVGSEDGMVTAFG